MILVDISAWVRFLRGTRSRVCEELDRLLDGDIAITDPIVMELLAGARDGRHLHELRALLGRTQMTRCGPRDFDAAALLLSEDALPDHADFEVLAQHTELVNHRA